MLYLTCFLHGNIQYGEFSPSQAPEIVANSYRPALEHFANHPHLPVLVEFSGYTLEQLAKHWPETLDLLGSMLQSNQVELLAGTYANPILPLIPTRHARLHVERFREIAARLLLAQIRPTGVYLQEFAYDPSLTPLLREFGYTYTILTPELLLAGMRRHLNTALQVREPRVPAMKQFARHALLHPVTALGAGEASIAAFPFHRDLLDLLYEYSSGRVTFDEIANLLSALDGAYCQEIPGLLILGPSDLEFIGYYGIRGQIPIRIEKLVELLERLAELPFIQLGLPGAYLEKYPPRQAVYVPAGSSEPSFDVWTVDPDNIRLNMLCMEAAARLELAETQIGKRDHATKQRLDDAWMAMLLAENSDGRGWMPHPERRLFCYNQALHVIRIAEELIAQSQA